jgi:hypothetical protein
MNVDLTTIGVVAIIALFLLAAGLTVWINLRPRS